ncbi:histidine kinase, partial [bacterium]|nr:histidine kinase [bacterium]
LSGDLMFASRVRSVADRAGFQFAFGGNLPDGDLSDVRYVVLDLATRGGLAGSLKAMCLERCPQAAVIAFGPHVQTERIQQAKESGIEQVLTNGQFDRSMHLIFN